jgi:hypothetical protein
MESIGPGIFVVHCCDARNRFTITDHACAVDTA